MNSNRRKWSRDSGGKIDYINRLDADSSQALGELLRYVFGLSWRHEAIEFLRPHTQPEETERLSLLSAEEYLEEFFRRWLEIKSQSTSRAKQ